MKRQTDKFIGNKISLGKVLKENGLETMSKDFEVIDRIFNLLTEGINIGKIKGILSTTQIVKYGGDLEDSEADEIFNDIINWWEMNKI
jgi:hypothetical protein